MTRALIIGVSGVELTAQEKAYCQEINPWGLILFRRNIDNPQQVRQLTENFRTCVGRPDAPVLVDQEGGRLEQFARNEFSQRGHAAVEHERFQDGGHGRDGDPGIERPSPMAEPAAQRPVEDNMVAFPVDQE